jgi:Rab-like protein 5
MAAPPATAKILFVGPTKAGKTSLTSFLAGVAESMAPAAAPAPTVGVRILEMTRAAGGAALELWDVSGDQSYENTWPAVQQGMDGIVLCYSPEAQGQAVRFSHVCHAWRLRPCAAHPLQTHPPPCRTPLPHNFPNACARAEGAGAVL